MHIQKESQLTFSENNIGRSVHYLKSTVDEEQRLINSQVVSEYRAHSVVLTFT